MHKILSELEERWISSDSEKLDGKESKWQTQSRKSVNPHGCINRTPPPQRGVQVREQCNNILLNAANRQVALATTAGNIE